MTKWDTELFRAQARAGLQGWYIHFLSEVDTTEGLQGPYGREDIAEEIMRAYLRVEEVALEHMLVSNVLPVSYFTKFHHCQVVQLTPHEFERLTGGNN